MGLKFTKSCFFIPAWTLIRRTIFAKSSASKFFPLNKKAFRGIDYFSSFLFLLICSRKTEVKSVAQAMFPQQIQMLALETDLVLQRCQTQEDFERQALSSSPIFVLHTVKVYPSLWWEVSFRHRICQLTILIWHTLIALLENHFTAWKTCLCETPSVRTRVEVLLLTSVRSGLHPLFF